MTTENIPEQDPVDNGFVDDSNTKIIETVFSRVSPIYMITYHFGIYFYLIIYLLHIFLSNYNSSFLLMHFYFIFTISLWVILILCHF